MNEPIEQPCRKARLLVLTNIFPLPWQPFKGIYNKIQLSELAKYFEIDVVVPVSWLEWLKCRDVSKEAAIGEIKVRYTPFFYTPLVGRSLYSVMMFLSLWLFQGSWLRRSQAECMLTAWAYPDAIAGALIARYLRIPFIVKVHGSDINVYAHYKLRAAQIGYTMQRSHGVLSVSEDLKTKICQLGVDYDKVHVVYNGVNRECFFYRDMKDTRVTLDIELNTKIILFVGNILESKGVLDLLQAFEKVYHILSNVFLYYIGDGGDAIRITAFSQEKGLKERVTLLGERDHKDIALWYAAADLVALPSHREGVPNVLLEAMACGTPVLATRIGGIPEVISEDVGVLVEAHDIESIASGLLQALSKPWEISKILRQSEAFSWESNVAAVRALIERTLKSVAA